MEFERSLEMAKKFGKLVLFSALTGAIAAGTYYLLQKKNESPFSDSDEIDDFDDFDEDLDDDFEDHPTASRSRSYVALDLENAKEYIGEKVMETIDKTKEKIVEFNVPEKLDKAKELVGEYTHSASESTKSHTEPTVSTTYTTVSSTPAPEQTSVYRDEANVETEEFFDDSED